MKEHRELQTLIDELERHITHQGKEVDRLRKVNAELLAALKHAENALADYVPTIEKTGAALNYGHHVIKMARAAIAKAEGQA